MKSIFDNDNFKARCKIKEKRRKAMIIHPGAFGDCILTLHLCDFLKRHMEIDVIDFVGNTDHIALFPGRTSVDKTRSINSYDFSKLFVPAQDFDPCENQKFVSDLAGYDWIFNFLGERGDDFEQNLIASLYLTTSGDVVTLDASAPADYSHHISQFHIDDFVNEKHAAIEAFTAQEDWTFDFEKPTVNVREVDRNKGLEILQNKFSNSCATAIIAPGSGGRGKCWHIENYKKLSRDLLANGSSNVLFVLGPVELEVMKKTEIEKLSEIAPVFFSVDTISFTQLLSSCDLFIGNDSGPAHLAAAIGLPTISIFGKTNPARYRPMGPNTVVIQGENAAFESRCDKSVAELSDAANSILKNSKPQSK